MASNILPSNMLLPSPSANLFERSMTALVNNFKGSIGDDYLADLSWFPSDDNTNQDLLGLLSRENVDTLPPLSPTTESLFALNNDASSLLTPGGSLRNDLFASAQQQDFTFGAFQQQPFSSTFNDPSLSYQPLSQQPDPFSLVDASEYKNPALDYIVGSFLDSIESMTPSTSFNFNSFGDLKPLDDITNEKPIDFHDEMLLLDFDEVAESLVANAGNMASIKEVGNKAHENANIHKGPDLGPQPQVHAQTPSLATRPAPSTFPQVSPSQQATIQNLPPGPSYPSSLPTPTASPHYAVPNRSSLQQPPIGLPIQPIPSTQSQRIPQPQHQQSLLNQPIRQSPAPGHSSPQKQQSYTQPPPNASPQRQESFRSQLPPNASPHRQESFRSQPNQSPQRQSRAQSQQPQAVQPQPSSSSLANPPILRSHGPPPPQGPYPMGMPMMPGMPMGMMVPGMPFPMMPGMPMPFPNQMMPYLPNLSPGKNANQNANSPPPLFPCHIPTCAKLFPSYMHLAHHIQTAHANQPYPSQQPPKSKPFACTLCPQTFSRSHDLKRHYYIHTQEKPYRCARCGKGFSRRDALKRHERSVKEGRKVMCREGAESEGEEMDEGGWEDGRSEGGLTREGSVIKGEEFGRGDTHGAASGAPYGGI